PESDGAHGGYAAGALVFLGQRIECRNLLRGCFPIEALCFERGTFSDGICCCAGGFFAGGIVLVPAPRCSVTSLSLRSLSRKPLTPAKAGRLLSPSRACCTFWRRRLATSLASPSLTPETSRRKHPSRSSWPDPLGPT